MQQMIRDERELGGFIESHIVPLLKKRANENITLALVGELGAGKTTFTRHLARSLGVEGPLISPTFLLLKSYTLPNEIFGKRRLAHIDAYRMSGPEELLGVGIEDLYADPATIIVIEWADRVQRRIPPHAFWFSFSIVGENERNISLQPTYEQ